MRMQVFLAIFLQLHPIIVGFLQLRFRVQKLRMDDPGLCRVGVYFRQAEPVFELCDPIFGL